MKIDKNNQKIKILQVLSSKGKGGMEQMFLNYSDAFALSDKFECHCLISNKTQVDKKKLQENGKLFVSKLCRSKILTPLFVIQLLYICLKNKIEVIIFHSPREARLFKIFNNFFKMFLVNHSENYLSEPRHNLTKFCKNIININPLIEKKMKEFHKNSTNNYITIPNFLILSEEDLRNANIKLSQRLKEFSIPKNKILTLGFLGSITKNKRCNILLQAIKILHDKNINLKLIIAGAKKEEDEEIENIKEFILKNKLQDYVEIRNFISGIEKENFFKEIDIFILPSLETFGLVILESWLYGVPTIMTESYAGDYLIRTGDESGLLVKLDNPIDLSEKITQMINNQEQTKEFIKNGFEKLESSFTHTSFLSKFEEIL